MSSPRGRPKSDNPKEVIFGIRLPANERELIEKVAVQAGRKASEWAREILVAKALNENKR